MNKRKYKKRRKKEWEQVASLLTDNCCVYITPERIAVFYLRPDNHALDMTIDSLQEKDPYTGMILTHETYGPVTIQGYLKPNENGTFMA